MLEDRPIREETAAGRKDDLGARAAIACKISNREGAPLIQNQVQNNDINHIRADDLYGLTLRVCQTDYASTPLEMAAPDPPKVGVSFNN